MFESSPGGNIITFELAPFKLSTEMIDIMGGRPDAEPFKLFMELGVKAFLACRPHTNAIVTLVEAMLDTQLPCFRGARGNPSNTLDHLRARLAPEKNEREAAKHMSQKMIEAFSSISIFSTYLYDFVQNFTLGIDY